MRRQTKWGAIARSISALLAIFPASLLSEVWRIQRRRLNHEGEDQRNRRTVLSADAVFLEQVSVVVDAQLHDHRFKVEGLAREVGLSSRQLQRKLRALTELSAAQYIRTRRLARAADLLAQQAGTVSEIAYATGFQDPKHFSKLFRQVYGVPPSRYRANRT